MRTISKKTLILVSMILISSMFACMLSNTQTAAVPTPTKIVPTFTFDKLLSTSDYLEDCKNRYPPNHFQQIGYKDIYPGKTTSEQVTRIYGLPKKYSFVDKPYDDWEIDDPTSNLRYSITASNNLVDFVTVNSDQAILLRVDELLEKFGCPELIVAVELDPSPDTVVFNYNTTFFLYLKNGIEIRFDGFPISYSSIASIVTFVKSYTLEEYLKTDALLITEAASPVTLDEAITDR